MSAKEIVVALVAGLLINEAVDASSWLALKLVSWAARLRYRDVRRRDTRAEEWAALIAARPGNFLKLLTALRLFASSVPGAVSRLRSRDVRPDSVSAAGRRLTLLALLIAGRRRAWRAEEFCAGLVVGGDVNGPAPSRWRRLRFAAGLVVAAVVFRVRDVGRFLGRILDWFLTEPRTEILVAGVGLVCGAYFVRTGGWSNLMNQLQNVAAAGGIVMAIGLWLRKKRDVRPRKNESKTRDGTDR